MHVYLNNSLTKRILDIPGWLSPNEIVQLYTTASLAINELPGTFLVEIGSWKGRSTVTIGLACKADKRGQLLAIDPGNEIDPLDTRFGKSKAKPTLIALQTNISLFDLNKYVIVVPLQSGQAWDKYRTRRIGLLFIDGDHAYEAVRFDVDRWTQSLVNGGYLLIHDTINHEGPRNIFLSLLLHPHYRYLGTTGDLACFQKKSSILFRSWVIKIYSFIVFWLLSKIYTPAFS